MILAIVVILLLSAADLAFSISMLRRGWMEEGNAIAARIWKRYGAGGLVVYKLGMLAIAAVILVILWDLDATHGVFLILGVALGGSAVTVFQLAAQYAYMKAIK